MADIASLEEDIKGYRDQLESIDSLLALEPDNDEYKALKSDIVDAIALTTDALHELRPPPPKASASSYTAPPPPSSLSEEEKPKWSIENHPAYQAGYRKPSESKPEPQAAFKVGDQVLAKWTSGDSGFYPARITSVTGSSANPIYYVEFKKYKNTEALRYEDLKQMGTFGSADSRKRKADGTAVSSSTTAAATAQAATPPANVITAAASMNPAFQKPADSTQHEPSKATDGPTRPAKIPKKVKGTKVYESGKSKWQAFSAKGGSKMAKAVNKKDSMFRTSDSVTSRVGFTGSGQAMRKDPSRSRHVYQAVEEDYGGDE